MDTLAYVLLFLGVAAAVLSSLAALWLRGVFVRVHYLAPLTTVAGPLIGLSLAIENGWGLTTALILFTVFLLAATGPVVEAATGRLAAQREGIVAQESPE